MVCASASGTSNASSDDLQVTNDFREFKKLMKYENTQRSFLEIAPVSESKS